MISSYSRVPWNFIHSYSVKFYVTSAFLTSRNFKTPLSSSWVIWNFCVWSACWKLFSSYHQIAIYVWTCYQNWKDVNVSISSLERYNIWLAASFNKVSNDRCRILNILHILCQFEFPVLTPLIQITDLRT